MGVSRRSLIQQSLQGSDSLFEVRPERICFELCANSMMIGCKFSLQHGKVVLTALADAGLLALRHPITDERILKVGDVLERSNGRLLRRKAAQEFIREWDQATQAQLSRRGEQLSLVFRTVPKYKTRLTLQISNKSQTFILKSHPKTKHLKYQNALVLAIGGVPALTLDPTNAGLLLEKAPSLLLILPRNFGKTAVVGVAGGTLLGVGTVLMASPLMPVGHALMLGGAAVLGTEFEAPRKVAQKIRQRRFRRQKPEEEEEQTLDELLNNSKRKVDFNFEEWSTGSSHEDDEDVDDDDSGSGSSYGEDDDNDDDEYDEEYDDSIEEGMEETEEENANDSANDNGDEGSKDESQVKDEGSEAESHDDTADDDTCESDNDSPSDFNFNVHKVTSESTKEEALLESSKVPIIASV